MTTTTLPAVPDTAKLTAAVALQTLVPELSVLTLDAKQAHWNVTGPNFLPLHMLTDEIAADLRVWTDRVAERAVALGNSVDGRPSTVAAAVVNPLSGGWLVDSQMITELVQRIDDVVARFRRVIDVVESLDPVSHNLTVDILEGLEKYRWMLRAQGSRLRA